MKASKAIVPVLGALTLTATTESGVGISIGAVGVPAVFVGAGVAAGIAVSIWWIVAKDR